MGEDRMSADNHPSADELEKRWADATVKTRDNLQSYLDVAHILYRQGYPDLTYTHIGHCRALLKELEELEVNPLLKA
jgi:hypothetical protein